MWDVIVVGARCAGASVALRFVRSGRSVLLLDRAREGSDTLSTHVLVPPAIARMDDLGLLDQLLATGAPPVTTLIMEADGQSFPSPVAGPHGFMLSIRRTVLDTLLVDAAAEAGATVAHRHAIDGVLREGDRVVGVHGRDSDGHPFERRARLVIGADGRHSTIARRVAAAEYNTLVCQAGAIYAYFQDVGESTAGSAALTFSSGPGCDALCCPCDGGLHVLLLIVSGEECTRILTAGTAAYDERVRTIPTLEPRLANAERVSTLHAASPRELRGYFRMPFGAGWALVGDAGYYAHPASANGIADALRSAELVHTLVERSWADGGAAEAYLGEYQSTRDAENTAAFYLSYRLGQVNPFSDPELMAMLAG